VETKKKHINQLKNYIRWSNEQASERAVSQHKCLIIVMMI
jgi:hypothetical protein